VAVWAWVERNGTRAKHDLHAEMIQSQLRVAAKQDSASSIFKFSPTNQTGDYFTLGCLEMFVLD
jgi:hypothetical protein